MKILFAPSLELRDRDSLVLAADAGRGLSPSAEALDRHSGGAISRAIAAQGYGSNPGEILEIYSPPGIAARSLILVGWDGDFRRMGAAIARHLQYSGAARAAIHFPLTLDEALDLAEGLRLAAYRPPVKYRSNLAAADHPSLKEALIALPEAAAAAKRFQALDARIKGVFLARDLAAEPANVLGPGELAERAALLSSLGVRTEVLEEKALEKIGARLLLAVGRGSVRPPRLAIMEWRGGEKGERPLALVGKGIVFDTGGIAIKPREGMEAMKADMGGAAAVIGAIRTLAGRNAPVNAVGIVALAENMPGADATRPGDVVKSLKGPTVEIVDPDAEGRLVLADALAYARKRFEPRAIVDLATLTGAIVTSLGRYHGGLFANDDRLADSLLAAGRAVGEPLWRMPFVESSDETLKSDCADLKNCGWGRVPDALDAARFLKHFVDDKIPWAHLDIAGVSEVRNDEESEFHLCPKGFSGFGVRLLDRWAETFRT